MERSSNNPCMQMSCSSHNDMQFQGHLTNQQSPGLPTHALLHPSKAWQVGTELLGHPWQPLCAEWHTPRHGARVAVAPLRMTTRQTSCRPCTGRPST
mmetsp:Transcript_119618/g.386183  ORF Transcript_119618/g.386183 Transcript_119618/m.386183 type:complete len:97 (+) Transcript_119618:29-319(+)